MLLARAVGPTGRVLTVEPDPTAADLLQANLEHNRCANITLIREAAGDAAGEIEFHLNEYVGWSSRTPNALQRSSVKQRVSVRMRALDDMLAAFAPPAGARVSWIKIDVEGGEAGVLRGATRLLAEHAPVLWMEVNPSSLSAAGSSPAELGELLRGHGYRFWRGHADERWWRRPRVWFTPVPRLADVTEETDVLCVPPSRAAELEPLLAGKGMMRAAAKG
jgi:FkbM family methyltransferase